MQDFATKIIYLLSEHDVSLSPFNPTKLYPESFLEESAMKEWTVMVYMAGGNNLSEDMVTTLRSLKEAGNRNVDQINILARFNTGYPSVPAGYYSFDAKDKDNSLFDCKLEDEHAYHEASSSQMQGSIPNFVQWSKANFDARRFMLILSGHGDGFQGKTLLHDNTQLGSLTPSKLRQELEQSVEILDSRLAVLGFDSCAMNMLELSYEFKDVADYLIASQGFIPKSGWSYEKPVTWLLENAYTASDAEVATKFVSEFAKSNFDYALGGRSIEMSVCKLSETENVNTELNNLGNELISIFDATEPTDRVTGFVREQFNSLLLTSHWRAQTYFYEQNVDLSDFCCILRESCEQLCEDIDELAGSSYNKKRVALQSRLSKVSMLCSRVEEACNRFVVISDFTGPQYQFARGVSVFFPWSFLALSVCQSAYNRLAINQNADASWSNFIAGYAYATMRSPTVENKQLSYPGTCGFDVSTEYHIPQLPAGDLGLDHRTGGPFRTGGPLKTGGTWKSSPWRTGGQYRTGGSFRTSVPFQDSDDCRHGCQTKLSDDYRHGDGFKGGLESWLQYFSTFKNYWIDWNVKKI